MTSSGAALHSIKSGVSFVEDCCIPYRKELYCYSGGTRALLTLSPLDQWGGFVLESDAMLCGFHFVGVECPGPVGLLMSDDQLDE